MLTTVGTVILSIVLATSASSGGGTTDTDSRIRHTGTGSDSTGNAGTDSDAEAISESIEAHYVNHVITINESNWSDMLYGEWLVKFYAPWCPACESMSSAWRTVAMWCDEEERLDRDVRVAEVDVTKNPGLTGRFMVTSLPTLFHVKDGTFRIYDGSRDEQDIYAFVAEEKYLQLPKLPWYWAPASLPMECVSLFFKAAVIARDIHGTITTTYGLPVWMSYVIFAISTILAGFVVALLLVCLCDKLLSSRTIPRALPSSRYPATTGANAMDDVSDVVEDDRPSRPSDITDDLAMGSGDYLRSNSTRRRH